jgi:Family of unknown function (DUF5670)
LRTTRDLQPDNALRADLRSSACAAAEFPSSTAFPRSGSVGVPVLSWRRFNFALQGDGSYIAFCKECSNVGAGDSGVFGSIGRKWIMLYTIAVVLLVLWLLGLVSGYTIGAFIHVLLVIAVVLFLVGLVSGRRVV